MKKEWDWHWFQLLGRQRWQIYNCCSFGLSGPRKSDSLVKNDSFWWGECFRISKIRFIDFLWNYFRGSNRGSIWRSQVSGLSSQVSGVRSQKLMLSLTRCARLLTDAIAYQIFILLTVAIAYEMFIFLTDAIAYQIYTFLTDAIAYQICPFYIWCYRSPDLSVL